MAKFSIQDNLLGLLFCHAFVLISLLESEYSQLKGKVIATSFGKFWIKIDIIALKINLNY